MASGQLASFVPSCWLSCTGFTLIHPSAIPTPTRPHGIWKFRSVVENECYVSLSRGKNKNPAPHTCFYRLWSHREDLQRPVWVQGNMSAPRWRKESAGFTPGTNIHTKPPKDGKIWMGKMFSMILYSHESAKFIYVVYLFGRAYLGHKTRSQNREEKT